MKNNKSLFVKDHYYKIIPLALILLIIPCIVYLKVITIKGVALGFSLSGDKSYDFFNYYKSVWLIVFTIVSVIFCILYANLKKLKLKLPIIFIPLLVYYVFVFLSSSFSKYQGIAFLGFTDRYEGFFVITCYLLICFMAANFVTYEKDIKILFAALVTCGLMVGIIGISQFWDFDFLQSDFGKHLMLSTDDYKTYKDILTFKFPKQYIYSTLYNPNFVGSFSAMLLPVSIAFAIFSKKLFHKIISCIFSCVIFINFIGCLSTTGYIAGIVSVVFLIVLLNKNFIKAWRIVLILLVSFTVLLFWMNNVSNGSILPGIKLPSAQTSQAQPVQTKFAELTTQAQDAHALTQAARPQTLQLQDSQPQLVKAQTLELQPSQPQPKPMQVQTSVTQQDVNSSQAASKNITDFSIDKNTLKIYMGSTVVNIIFKPSDSSCSFTDDSGKELEVKNDATNANIITFIDSRFEGLAIKFDSSLLNISAPNITFNVFISPEEKVFKFIDHKGLPTDIVTAQSLGFKGHEKWGSSRGYIWSRSLPLVKDTIFIGHGPDTFPFYFPQNEFNSKLKYFDTPYVLVDKPHNMYLQMALNTGVLSLVAFLVFVLWFIISAIRLYIKPKSINTYYVAGVSCVTAVVGFLVASLANDSVISVSPVFWILLGIGIASNRLYSNSISVVPIQQQSKSKRR